MTPVERSKKRIETASVKLTHWIGSTASVISHSIFFLIMLILPFFGVGFERILLVLTTAVSLEAIYLSIFIQMTVNRHSQELEEVSEDIEEIQEDMEEIQEDVSEIQEDVDEIQEDVEDIGEEIEEDEKSNDEAMMRKIETTLSELMREIQELKNSKK
jgi:uncharacterized protein YoxC